MGLKIVIKSEITIDYIVIQYNLRNHVFQKVIAERLSNGEMIGALDGYFADPLSVCHRGFDAALDKLYWYYS